MRENVCSRNKECVGRGREDGWGLGVAESPRAAKWPAVRKFGFQPQATRGTEEGSSRETTALLVFAERILAAVGDTGRERPHWKQADQARSWCGDQVQDTGGLNQDSGNGTGKSAVRRHVGNGSKGPGTERCLSKGEGPLDEKGVFQFQKEDL